MAFVSIQASAEESQWEKWNTTGTKAYRQGRYVDAEKSLEATLKETEHFEPQDLRLAVSLNNLAALYETQGKYAEAEPLYERSLSILEETLRSEHPLVAGSLNN